MVAKPIKREFTSDVGETHLVPLTKMGYIFQSLLYQFYELQNKMADMESSILCFSVREEMIQLRMNASHGIGGPLGTLERERYFRSWCEACNDLLLVGSDMRKVIKYLTPEDVSSLAIEDAIAFM